MDDPAPYHAPSAAPPPIPLTREEPPPAVRVFGILHLVLAGLGFLGGFWGFFSARFVSMLQGLSPDDPTMAIQQKYTEELWPVTVMSSVFSLGLAVLLTVAGLKLVRSQAGGIRWSNGYSWASIATKVVSLVVAVAYVLPVTNRMMDEIIRQTPGLPAGASGMMTGVMKSMSSASTVAGPVISCIYPVLALFFLNRPTVKAWASPGR